MSELGLYFDADLLLIVYAANVPISYHHHSSPHLYDLEYRKTINLEASRKNRDLPLHSFLHPCGKHYPQPTMHPERQSYLRTDKEKQ